MSPLRQGDPDLAQTEEGYELRRIIFWAGALTVLQRIKRLISFSRSYNVFICIVCLLIVSGPYFGLTIYASYLMILAGFVSLARKENVIYWEEALKWLWERPAGKLVYVIIAAIVAALSKVMSDQQIRSLIQTSPTRFPTAQQILLVYNGVSLVLLGIGAALILRAMLDMCVKAVTRHIRFYVGILDFLQISEFIGYKPRKPILGDFVRYMSFVLSGVAMIASVIELDTVFGIKDQYGNSVRLSEELIVGSSFLKNERQGVTGQAHSGTPFCMNLDADIYVSPSQEGSISDEVFTAKLRRAPSQVSRFEYGASRCLNSNHASEDRPAVRLGPIFTRPTGN